MNDLLVAARAVPIVLALAACAPSLQVTRISPPALGDAKVIAIAASGPYALELVGGLRASLAPKVTVEGCVLGCPAVGLYASTSLTPGPQEGRLLRTCQLEVYEGESWVRPTKKRAELVRPVAELEDCLEAMRAVLLEPSSESRSVPLDARGALEPAAKEASRGHLDEARRLLRAVLEKEPSSAGAQYDLGVIAEASGDAPGAAKAYAAARKLQPDPWLAARLETCP